MSKAAPEILSKITTATLGVEVKGVVHKDKQSVELYKVAGVARKYQKGDSNYGEYTRFIGEFLAVLPDGKRFKSSKLFLPKLVESELEVALDAASGGEVQFAFDIGLKFDAKASIGYAYTVKPIVKIEESDAMKQLESKLFGEPAALPPTETAKKK